MTETTEELFGISPDDVESCVRKLENASDNYAKMDVFEQFGVDWGDRKKALWALIRHDHYAAWNDPAIWYELGDSVEHATAEDIVKLLANVEKYDAETSAGGDDSGSDGYDDYASDYGGYDYGGYDYGGYGGYEEPAYESPRLVSFWPQYLDDLAMHAYAANAELVEGSLADFHPDVQKGMTLVKQRFGTLDGDLPEETLTELAKTHVWGSLPWRVFDFEDGELVELILGSSDENGPENQKKFIGYFADEDAWANAVLESIFTEDYGPSFGSTLPAWPVASLDQVEWLLDNVSIYNQDRVKTYDLLLDVRNDSVEDLLKLAGSLAENNQDGAAEMAAVAAVHRAKREGTEPPTAALDYITFQSFDSAYKRTDYFSLPALAEALQAFGVEAVRPRFEAAFEHQFMKMAPMPAVSVFGDDEALLERAFETVNVYAAEDGKRFSSMNKAAFGLGMLGTGALEPLAAALEASDVPLARDTFRRAIMGVLADAEGPQDEKYDQYVTLEFDSPADITSEHDLGHYVAADYRGALAKMGEERAAKVVARDLDGDNPNWHRALAALPGMPKPELLDRAFGVIAREGLPPSDGYNWFNPLLYDLREEIKPFVGPALAVSDSPEFHNAIKQQFGEEQYQEMLDAAGGESAADAGQAGKIARLANAWFEANPEADRTVIYVMDRSDEPPTDGSMNRIGGRPFGFTAENWPHKDEETPMEHVLTIDLDAMPAFHSRYKEEVRAFSLFMSSRQHNKAWTPGNPDTEVLTIMRDDAAEFEGALPAGDENAVGFTVEEVEVPTAAFTVPYDGDADLRQVKNAIYSASAWGGGAGPIWLQGDEYFGMFLLQFDESFVYTNLGDSGIMYVFDDTAFWQCH